LEELLRRQGVRLSLVADPTRPTVSKLRVIANKQQLLRIDHEDTTPLRKTIASAIRAGARQALSEVDAVIIADYAKGVVDDALITQVIDDCNARKIPVFVDSKRSSFSAFRGASYIKPNRLELENATGINCSDECGIIEAAEYVARQTSASILVTQSEQGMFLYQIGLQPIHMFTEAQEVFDVSGAGDTVIAMFTLGIITGYPIQQAMRLANIAAGIVVSKMGTATVTSAEVQTALDIRDDVVPHASSPTSWEQALWIREQWRRDGLRVGFTNGCFDLLHPGHIAILQGSAAHCDRLIVGLNTDASIRQLKGSTRPIQHEAARAEVIGAIGCVDLVVLFDEPTPHELISCIVPDVLIK
ncbi:MAG: bifunctional heptose 7-phosphate kinase/heptose 1-phosphate adenyltransferase, partial [Hyphomicrobiales bacterium]